MSHTQGPWKVQGVCPVFVRANGSTIAEVINHDNVLSNAALLAAAPDLYEALQACAAELDALDIDDLPRCLRLARAAIAKANGAPW